VAGILSVLKVKRHRHYVNKIIIEFSKKLDSSTVSESDFLINDGTIGFCWFELKANDKTVECEAKSNLNGDELITISGDIKDIEGNLHNNGIAVTHGFR
ncbi:MAG: hypothetical protein J7L04_11065, partial [Bacteroidales bacterium]|nr:hypothetical protein [Bacteroidales bacterium]